MNKSSEIKKCFMCEMDVSNVEAKQCQNCGMYIKFMPRFVVLPLALIVFFPLISSDKYVGTALIALLAMFSCLILFVIDAIKGVAIRHKSGYVLENSKNAPFVASHFKISHISGLKFTDLNQKISCTVGDDFVLFADKDSKTLALIKYSDIQNLSILEELEQTQKNKSAVGRAVVGGLLLGPVGAIVGGISGVCPTFKTNKKYYLEITPSEDSRESIVVTADSNALKRLKQSIADKVLGTQRAI